MSSTPPTPPLGPGSPVPPSTSPGPGAPANWPKPGEPRQPPDFKNVFPYLNPPLWEGKASCLTRPLCDADKMPTVSFGQDLLQGVGMIMIRTACEEGFTLAKVEPEAVKNLAARPGRPTWQTDSVDWQGKSRTIYYRSGDERTASDLLDAEFLQAMHTAMDCQDVAVGIPSASLMIACPRDMALGLAPVVEQQYADMQSQGAEVLTPQILSVVEGRLQGFLDVGERTEDFPGPEPEES